MGSVKRKPLRSQGSASAVPVTVAAKHGFLWHFRHCGGNLLSKYPQRSAKIRGHFPQSSSMNSSNRGARLQVWM